jgi:STAS-like domain of unknown function (DUF4325)
MSVLVHLSHYGTTFSTRPRGLTLREMVLDQRGTDDIELDFASVTSVSYSFADEFVARLVAQAAPSVVTIIDAVPAVERVLSRALSNREVTARLTVTAPAT